MGATTSQPFHVKHQGAPVCAPPQKTPQTFGGPADAQHGCGTVRVSAQTLTSPSGGTAKVDIPPRASTADRPGK